MLYVIFVGFLTAYALILMNIIEMKKETMALSKNATIFPLKRSEHIDNIEVCWHTHTQWKNIFKLLLTHSLKVCWKQPFLFFLTGVGSSLGISLHPRRSSLRRWLTLQYGPCQYKYCFLKVQLVKTLVTCSCGIRWANSNLPLARFRKHKC